MTSLQPPSLQMLARWAGIFYLAIIGLGLFGEAYVRTALVVPGNPGATMQAIANAPLLWRAGIAGDLLMHVLDIPVIVALYYLLKPVSKGLALLATAFNLIQTAVLVANKMTLLVPLFLLSPAGHLKNFTPEQLESASLLAIQAHSYGFGVGLIFFGFACLVRGYLLLKASYFPKVLGVLMLAAGAGYLINSFALLLAPGLASLLFPMILLLPFVGELAFALWLTARGVNVQEWERCAQSTR